MFTTWEGLRSRVDSIEFSLLTKFEEKLQEERKQREGEGKMNKKDRETGYYNKKK